MVIDNGLLILCQIYYPPRGLIRTYPYIVATDLTITIFLSIEEPRIPRFSEVSPTFLYLHGDTDLLSNGLSADIVRGLLVSWSLLRK